MTTASYKNAVTFSGVVSFLKQPNMLFTTAPTTSLDIGYNIGTSNVSESVNIGYNVGSSGCSGINTCIGNNMTPLTTSTGNTLIGRVNPGFLFVGGSFNCRIGTSFSIWGSGDRNVSMGASNAFGYTTGISGGSWSPSDCTVIGSSSARTDSTSTTMSLLTIVGFGSMQSTAGVAKSCTNIVTLGALASNVVTAGNNCVAIGYSANLTGNSQTFCTALGSSATWSSSLNKSTSLGYSSTSTTSNKVTLGTTAEQVTVPGNLSLNTAGANSFEIFVTQPHKGSSYKKVVLYCDNTSGDTTLTFPTAFIHTPVIRTTNSLSAGIVTGLSTSGCTVTGAGNTGFLIIEGF